MEYLKITESDRKKGTYYRYTYAQDTIYTFYLYREICAFYSRGQFITQDRIAEKLLKTNQITALQAEEYHTALTKMFSDFRNYHMLSVEEIYENIVALRLSILGDGNAVSVQGTEITGIDQRDILIEKLRNTEYVLVYADEEYEPLYHTILPLMEHCKVIRIGNELKMDSLTLDLERLYGDEALQQAIDLKRCLLIVLSESGLLACRKLLIDSFVFAQPESYYTRPQVNFVEGISCVYIPAHWDMTAYVPLFEKTMLTWYHTAELYHKYGMAAYTLSVNEMYRREPALFANIYGIDGLLPLKITPAESYREYCNNREKAISELLNQYPGVDYISAYFDESMQQVQAPFGCVQAQNGIFVNAVKVRKPCCLNVLETDGDHNLRDLMKESTGVHLLSNFLFFMTPKLQTFYNLQRKDRPYEQLLRAGGHLDYRKADGKESFPLYAKACVSADADGCVHFFHLKPERGTIRLGQNTYTFEREDVNASNDRDLIIYTPYCSMLEETDELYAVGEGRLNIVVVQNEVVCIRKGDVLMPSIGVVISLKEDTLLQQLVPLEDGYYRPDLSFELELDHPYTGQAVLAYGGGIMLINDGCDYQLADLQKEGWMCPLSRQTQETPIEKPARHPRTAIGLTEDGSFVILVFNGRSLLSAGADYDQMCSITHSLFPDIRYLMNVDGGGSSQLGISIDGIFMELSLPASSDTNTAGMGRKITTGIDLRIGE